MLLRYPLRTVVDSQELRAKYVDDDDRLKQYGLKPNIPFTDPFQFSDIYSMIAPDLLHQVSKMFYDDIFSNWIMKYLEKSQPVSKKVLMRELNV